jgi:phospholipid/cholesterol/gamma-HCH transport system substrate-binding protein
VKRALRAGTFAALAAVTITGCGFKGAYSLPLPGGAAHGPTYQVTAVFDDVQDLTPQAAVRVNDVAVGDVTGITVGKDLKAHVRMKIDSSVHLPANAVATLDQTTLLGEKFVALAPPGNGVAPRGRLANGAVLEDGSTADLPDVEEVFGLLSNVLNGGDLGDLQTITVELTKALSGREAAVRDVLSQLTTFVSALNTQKSQIVRALDQLDRLTTTLRKGDSTIATALDDLGPGLKVLADERVQFRGLLVNLSRFGKVATRVINASRADTIAGLRDLQPILGHLAAAGGNLPRALEILITFPFPRDIDAAAPGDYTNLEAELDLGPIVCSLLSALPVPKGADPGGLLDGVIPLPAGVSDAQKAVLKALLSSIPDNELADCAPGSGGGKGKGGGGGLLPPVPVPTLPPVPKLPKLPVPVPSLPAVPVPTPSGLGGLLGGLDRGAK